MEIIDLNIQNINSTSLINRIKKILDEGNLLVYPTDTLYALGADPYNADSVKLLNKVKGRSEQQHISIAVPDTSTVKSLSQMNSKLEKAVDKLLPGPVTFIVNAGESAPKPVITEGGTLGIRMPNHPEALALLKQTGPLTVTSANRHGGDEPADIETAKAQLGDSVALYLNCGICKLQIVSTILDFTAGEPRILREGVLSRQELEQQLDYQVD